MLHLCPDQSANLGSQIKSALAVAAKTLVDQESKSAVLNQLLLLEPQTNLLVGRSNRVGTVANVSTHVNGKVTSDGTWGRLQWVGGTHVYYLRQRPYPPRVAKTGPDNMWDNKDGKKASLASRRSGFSTRTVGWHNLINQLEASVLESGGMEEILFGHRSA
ncbi:hypothetical protein JCM33374_g6670 [Metschnikowia sp. JCM 33374]|nr:hypothetical protein JCM33374_g6670 [Metschnikowia sp. JCM 33374]